MMDWKKMFGSSPSKCKAKSQQSGLIFHKIYLHKNSELLPLEHGTRIHLQIWDICNRLGNITKNVFVFLTVCHYSALYTLLCT